MKNILFLIDNLDSGGAQNQISLIASKLSQEGHRVHLITYNAGDFFLNRITGSNCQHYPLKGGKNLIKRILQIRRYIKKHNIEHLVSFLNASNIYSSLAVLGLKKCNFYPSYRSSTDLNHISLFDFLSKSWVGFVANKVICNSYHEAKTLNGLRTMKSKTGTIYNGIQSDSIIAKSDHTLRNRVIMVGKLRKPKNADFIFKLFSKYPDLKFDIDWYGGIDFTNEAMKKYANEFVEKTKSLPNCNWTWKNVENEIGKKYAEYDFLLHPSLREGLPNVVCEAMMAGLPVLASNILDHPHLLDHDDRLLFDPNSEEDLLSKITSFFLLDSEERKSISTKLKLRAKSLLSMEKTIKSYLHLLQTNKFLTNQPS